MANLDTLSLSELLDRQRDLERKLVMFSVEGELMEGVQPLQTLLDEIDEEIRDRVGMCDAQRAFEQGMCDR